MTAAPTPAPPEMAIGDRIRKARRTIGLSQEALAKKLHTSRQAVGSWELGDSEPRLETIRSLGDALDVPPEWLAFGRTTLSGWKCSPPLTAVTIPPGQMALPLTSDHGTSHLSPVPDR